MYFLSHYQAIDSIHQVGVYCLALVPANTLPKAPLGGIHISETKQRFLEGALHPCNVLMCPHTCVTNLPKPRQKQPGTGESCACAGVLVFCPAHHVTCCLCCFRGGSCFHDSRKPSGGKENCTGLWERCITAGRP